MSQAEKLLEQMARNPRADWTIHDIIRVCEAFGARCCQPTRGSHYKVAHPRQANILTVPYNKPIKPIYIRLLVAYIKGTLEQSNGQA